MELASYRQLGALERLQRFLSLEEKAQRALLLALEGEAKRAARETRSAAAEATAQTAQAVLPREYLAAHEEFGAARRSGEEMKSAFLLAGFFGETAVKTKPTPTRAQFAPLPSGAIVVDHQFQTAWPEFVEPACVLALADAGVFFAKPAQHRTEKPPELFAETLQEVRAELVAQLRAMTEVREKRVQRG